MLEVGVKAPDFDSGMRRFESFHPSHKRPQIFFCGLCFFIHFFSNPKRGFATKYK